jgi:hypothetical protein
MKKPSSNLGSFYTKAAKFDPYTTRNFITDHSNEECSIHGLLVS